MNQTECQIFFVHWSKGPHLEGNKHKATLLKLNEVKGFWTPTLNPFRYENLSKSYNVEGLWKPYLVELFISILC